MTIYDINGTKLLDAILTEGGEHEEELGKTNLVRLSWNGDKKVTLPAGAYIIPFNDGLKYRLLDAYTPSEDSKQFKYAPEFHHPLMILSRVPFLYSTTDQSGTPIKQQEWSFDGLTTTALQHVCDAINETFGFTTEKDKFTYTLCGTVDSSVNFSVSSNDILSVISLIAQACKSNICEGHLSWEHRTLYFGQVSINLAEDVPLLKVHDNLQVATVTASKEAYYNCFYPQGSTKNMSRKAQVGTGNVATLARLCLNTDNYPDGCIYIDANGKIISKPAFDASNAVRQTLALSFDDVYPHINLYAYNIRKRTQYVKNSDTGEYMKDKVFTIWYMRLAYCTTEKDTTKTLVNTTTDKDEQGNTITHYWYDYELDPKKQVLQGHSLMGTFKVNTHTTNNKYDALTQALVGQPNGQDGFEFAYHESSQEIPSISTTGDSGISIQKGDYEIIKYQSGDTIIPSNEEDGLIPRGNRLPDLTCNIVILFNIVMGEYETTLAQEELATRTVKEIERRTRDNNNYTAPSNAVEFAKKNPNLYIGQQVTYDDGQGYQLSTRVIKLVTKLDYPIIQEITVGNQAVKGNITQLKEDVKNILSGNFSGGGLNERQVSDIIRNYTDKRFLSKLQDDIAQGHITFQQGLTAIGLAVFKDGAHFGEFVKSLYAGKGAGIDAQGNAEVESLRVRSYFECLELIVNRLSAIEGDQLLTEADTIESVDDLGDGCFGLHLKSKWDGYFTAQAENNVLKGIINTLAQGSGKYYTAWFRVNSVNTANNYIEVTQYPDTEVPSGKNYPPCEMMKIARWGNQTDTKRQDCLYLSSTEGRIVKLKGVTKPILDNANYGAAFGSLPEFVYELLDDNGNPLPIRDGLDYMYIPGIVTMDVIRLNKWTGKPLVTYVDRGAWTQSGKYYCDAINPDTGEYETSDVWFNGCKYRCCKNLTTIAPAWNNTDWAMIEGNPDFAVDFQEPESIVDPDKIDLTLTIVATLYNMNITDDILDADVMWTRYSEDAEGNERTASDNVWSLRHANTGKSLHLTAEDMDFNGYMPKVIRFTATVTLRDGMGNEAATAAVSYEY